MDYHLACNRQFQLKFQPKKGQVPYLVDLDLVMAGQRDVGEGEQDSCPAQACTLLPLW